MKRLLLGTVAASFLALVGVQAAHFHRDSLESGSDSCAVCVLAHQSVQQAPNAAPSAFQSSDFQRVLLPVSAGAFDRSLVAASARAPPATA
ncbi:MAG: hypothetical protein HY077_12030 [Elusimicrobia bacterium]|nr:hypothetical protein [Elusimicrobiota bacterium]